MVIDKKKIFEVVEMVLVYIVNNVFGEYFKLIVFKKLKYFIKEMVREIVKE